MLLILSNIFERWMSSVSDSYSTQRRWTSGFHRTDYNWLEHIKNTESLRSSFPYRGPLSVGTLIVKVEGEVWKDVERTLNHGTTRRQW